MSLEFVLLILALAVGIYMAWNIGANDVANAMGTAVGAGSLTLRKAVIIAVFLEFAGVLLVGSHVSATVQEGIVDPLLFKEEPLVLVIGMLASLFAAGAWLQIASYKRWPVSTTHTIIGALMGFGFASKGWHAVHWGSLGMIFSSWIISPIMGGTLSFILFSILRKTIFSAPSPVRAAKKIVPWIVFVFLSLLSLLLVFKGLSSADLYFSTNEMLFLGFFIATIAALCTHFRLRSIHTKNSERLRLIEPDPYLIRCLDKTVKHLSRAHKATTGTSQIAVEQILMEARTFSKTLEQPARSADDIGEEFQQVERIFSYLQVISASFMAFAHGANDVANAIGPLSSIINTLDAGEIVTGKSVATWLLVLGGVSIVLGLATWGWRVIETIGKGITELTPTRGFSAEFGAVLTILLASKLGLPISTTHTLVGAVLGVGLCRGISAINLDMVRNIFLSWVITVPVGAAFSITFFYLTSLFL